MSFIEYLDNTHTNMRSIRFDFKWFVVRLIITTRPAPGYRKVAMTPYYIQAIIY